MTPSPHPDGVSQARERIGVLIGWHELAQQTAADDYHGQVAADLRLLLDGVSLLGDTMAPSGALSDLKPSIPQGESTAAGGWLPIESAPKDGTEVLTYRSVGLMAVAAWFEYEPIWRPGTREGGWTVSDGADLTEVTHWRPLPPPPAAGQDLSEAPL